MPDLRSRGRWTVFWAAIVIAGASAITGAALAQPSRVWPSQSLGQGTPALPPCQCRADRKMHDLGATACINGQVAVCVLDQNVTNWRPRNESCAPAS